MSTAKHSKTYRERLKDKGLCEVKLIVPISNREDIKQTARKMRERMSELLQKSAD